MKSHIWFIIIKSMNEYFKKCVNNCVKICKHVCNDVTGCCIYISVQVKTVTLTMEDDNTCGGGEGALGGCAAAGGAGRDGGRDGLLSDRPLICRDSAAFNRAANWSCEMFTSPRYM